MRGFGPRHKEIWMPLTAKVHRAVYDRIHVKKECHEVAACHNPVNNIKGWVSSTVGYISLSMLVWTYSCFCWVACIHRETTASTMSSPSRRCTSPLIHDHLFKDLTAKTASCSLCKWESLQFDNNTCRKISKIRAWINFSTSSTIIVMISVIVMRPNEDLQDVYVHYIILFYC